MHKENRIGGPPGSGSVRNIRNRNHQETTAWTTQGHKDTWTHGRMGMNTWTHRAYAVLGRSHQRQTKTDTKCTLKTVKTMPTWKQRFSGLSTT